MHPPHPPPTGHPVSPLVKAITISAGVSGLYLQPAMGFLLSVWWQLSQLQCHILMSAFSTHSWCQLSRVGFSGKPALRRRLLYSMFLREGSGEPHPWKGEERSRIGQRKESSCGTAPTGLESFVPYIQVRATQKGCVTFDTGGLSWGSTSSSWGVHCSWRRPGQPSLLSTAPGADYLTPNPSLFTDTRGLGSIS